MQDDTTTPTAGPLSLEERAELLAQPWVARLSVLDDQGYPYVVPLWYEFDGNAYWIVAREHVRYVRLLRRDPRCALSIVEDAPPHRRVLVRGRAEIVEGPALEGRWKEVLGRLALRYRGPAGANYIESTREIRRWLVRIHPERTLSVRGV